MWKANVTRSSWSRFLANAVILWLSLDSVTVDSLPFSKCSESVRERERGVIILAKWTDSSFLGNMVALRHDNNYRTHMTGRHVTCP